MDNTFKLVPQFENTRTMLEYVRRLEHDMRNEEVINSISKWELWCLKQAVDSALRDAPEFPDDPDYHAIHMMMKLRSEI